MKTDSVDRDVSFQAFQLGLASEVRLPDLAQG
jgi:hypothetical protein